MFDRGVMLHHHLQYNHFPPISTQLVPTCEAALDDPAAEAIELPNGRTASAADIIEALHLEGFMDNTED